jgi:sigma-B regulation protein RsbU (phosphoserine phosphatase)
MNIKSVLPINLESLIELSARLNETHDLAFILNAALLSLMGKLKVFSGCVLIPDEEKNEFKTIICKGKLSFNKAEFMKIQEFRAVDSSPNDNYYYENGVRYFSPIVYQNEMIALICLGKRLVNGEFTKTEVHYANLVSSITANALQNAKNHLTLLETKNKVEQRNLMLSSLFEISRDFSMLLSRNQITKMLSYRLMGQLMVSKFAVYLMNENYGYLPLLNRFEKEIDSGIFDDIDIDSIRFVKEMEFTETNIEMMKSIGIELISPMINQGLVKGYLLIGHKMSGEVVTNENLSFAEALGNTALFALENERLFLEELEKKRLESEMNLALDIQKRLLPKSAPIIEGYDVSGLTVPSRHVGGDYYDFIKLPNGETLFVIADVSGKGMPASLIMANLQAALKVLCPLGLSLNQLILNLNNVVYQNTSADKFVTLFCGILNPNEHTFHYINAGHNPPLLINEDGKLNTLSEGGLILGIVDYEYPYEDTTIVLSAGDLILMYTDGVTEAKSKDDDEYGEGRLENFGVSNRNLKASELTDAIYHDLQHFFTGAIQSDDITLTVLKRL